MKLIPFLSVLTGLVAAGTTIASPPATPGPDPALITTIKQGAEAIQQEDLPKTIAYFAKNARFLYNATPVLTGRDSLATYWLKTSFSHTSNTKVTILNMGGDATMGYATGYYTSTIDPMPELPSGATTHGSFMNLYRKEASGWKITYVHLAEDAIKPNK